MHCECPICKDFERMNAVIQSRDAEALILLLKEFSNRWLNAAMDNEYYECIFNGSWPASVEILKNSLQRIENHKRKEVEHRAHQLYLHRVKFKLQGDQLSDWLIAEHFVESAKDAAGSEMNLEDTEPGEIPF